MHVHNLLVGLVYRQFLLPILEDMQCVLVDAPYHTLCTACSRLTPVLHIARMVNCRNMLREVVRSHNDTGDMQGGDLAMSLLPSLDDAQLSTLQSSLLGAVTAPVAGSVSGETHTSGADSHGRASPGSQHVGRSSGASLGTNPAGGGEHATLSQVAGASTGTPFPAPLPASSGATTAEHFFTIVQQHMGSATREAQGAPLTAGSRSEAPAGSLTAAPAPLAGSPTGSALAAESAAMALSTEEELELLYTAVGGLPGPRRVPSPQHVHLTSFVPGQDDYMTGAPALYVFDPDQPPSLTSSVSDAHSVISHLVAATVELQDSALGSGSTNVLRASPHAVSRSASGVPSAGTSRASGAQPAKSSSGAGSCSTGVRGAAGTSAPQATIPGSAVLPATSSSRSLRSSSGVRHSSSTSEAAVPPSSNYTTLDGPMPRLGRLLAYSVYGFNEPRLERRFRRYWGNTTWVMDVVTLFLTLSLAALSLHGSASQAEHVNAHVIVAALGAPLLVAPYLLVAHRKVTGRHRELIVVCSRLINTCMWAAMLGVRLHAPVGFMQRLQASRPARLAVAHFKNGCRPVLLSNAVVCSLTEAMVVAALAGHTRLLSWLVECVLLWASTLASTAALDMYTRRMFLGHMRAAQHAARHPATADSPGSELSTGSSGSDKTVVEEGPLPTASASVRRRARRVSGLQLD